MYGRADHKWQGSYKNALVGAFVTYVHGVAWPAKWEGKAGRWLRGRVRLLCAMAQLYAMAPANVRCIQREIRSGSALGLEHRRKILSREAVHRGSGTAAVVAMARSAAGNFSEGIVSTTTPAQRATAAAREGAARGRAILAGFEYHLRVVESYLNVVQGLDVQLTGSVPPPGGWVAVPPSAVATFIGAVAEGEVEKGGYIIGGRPPAWSKINYGKYEWVDEVDGDGVVAALSYYSGECGFWCERGRGG